MLGSAKRTPCEDMAETAFEVPDSQAIYDVPLDDDSLPKTNGEDHGANGDEPPLKKRRLSEGTPTTLRKKQVSPPWKKIVAEGPSSFTQDGIRKSGRTNQIPLELQPPSNKRQTRGAVPKTYTSKVRVSAKSGSRHSLPAGSTFGSGSSNSLTRRPASSGKGDLQQSTKSPATSPKRTSRSSQFVETSPTPVRSHKAKPKVVQNGDHRAEPQKARRSGRGSEVFGTPATNSNHNNPVEEDEEQASKSHVRIRFKIKPAAFPVVHPEIALRKPKQYSTFEEFVEKGSDVPIEEGGLLSIEEDVKYTEEMATREAQSLMRMEDAVQEGGVLSLQLSPDHRSDDFERENRKILKQYSHQDHLVRAVIEFRLLMVEEHKKHKRAAKRLAEACRDEWNRKQPKTLEEIEADEFKATEARYKFLVKSLQATWDNVKAEVNRRRIKDWEAEEQVRVRKALNEAVDISTQKLEARRVRRDSEPLTDEDENETSLSDDSVNSSHEESDSNMSSSESDADEERQPLGIGEDEHLTVEELRLKYSSLPQSPGTQATAERNELDIEDEFPSELVVATVSNGLEGDVDDESDESIDMDDDLDSSDDDSDDGSNSSDVSDDSDDEPGNSTLLGFLTPSDRAALGVQKSMLSSTEVDDEGALDEEDILDEEDEVSLIPDATSLHPFSQTAKSEVATTEVINLVDQQSATMESVNDKQPSPEIDVEMHSGDRSSQPTPVSMDTRPSELDSASSIEPHQVSRQVTPSATPQPSSSLKTPVPFLLRGTLREYQHYGLDWLAGLYANNTNGILADEMGLGKTIQTIALLAHLACEHHVWGPHLVIVPTSVMLNWEMEFKKWCPGFKILTYYGTQEERKKKRIGWLTESWNVCITSYQLVLQDQAVFKRKRWHYMILDEAHNIKNFRSQRWQTLLMFNTRARLLLTGTPLQNNLSELWSLLFFLMPSDGTEPGVGGFADLKEFSDWFRKPQEQILENGRETMDDEARAIISKLHKVLRPYLLRRMKADVEKQMPAKYEHVEYVRLSKRQRELYDGFLSRSDTRGTLASGNYLSIINCLMQLRKVCNHPDLFQERPILSSFPMKKSVIADFEIKDLLVRRRLLRQDPMTQVSLEFLNLVPTRNEHLSGTINERSAMLTAQRVLMDMREAQRLRAQYALTSMNPSTIKSNLVFLESASRWSRFEELQHCVYLNALRRQQKPIYGSQLVGLLDLGMNLGLSRKKPDKSHQLLDWHMASGSMLQEMAPTLKQRAQSLETTIQKFACITPPILAPDALPLVLSRKGVEYFQTAPDRDKPDPFHEARMRLSVQFPDKRLLQYDCGKLQTLDKLLRRLQKGGHRALIFTQMTKVLDILEQFLNIHGHKYLRLDGSTKIEQRQILTDRFNNDTRILAFILSSRSGGLGINLTGADTVIFYDLDWNPAMDKQCQDRCHRIGQTREVHIYRLVSEHTIEANILRKANQKRMLDDVVIQEGEFTTDYFNKMSVRDVLGDEGALLDGDATANAAMDRVLGGPSNEGDVQRILAQAEDQEDVAAAKVAQQEEVQTDAADFDEKMATATASATPRASGQDTPMNDVGTPDTGATALEALIPGQNESVDADDETNAWGEPVESTDHYMLRLMTAQLKDAPLELPKDKNKSKRGKDHRNRSHRAR